MKLRNLFMAVVAGAAMLVGCNKEVDLGPAKLALDQTTLAFEAAGGSQTVSVTATRDWAVSGVPDWVALSATNGKAAVEAQPVKITVAQNAEYNRSATIVFTIGFARTALTINQAGPEGEYEMPITSVADFIQKADKENVYKLRGTVSKFNPTYCSFDLTDASGTIYVWSVLDAYKTDEWKNKIKNGGTITITGKYEYYASKEQHEVVDAAILEYTDGEGGGDDYSKAEAKTVAEFITAADENTYYKLTGTVGGSINATYGNFDLTDASGTIFVYGTQNWSEWKDKVKNGSTVTLAAKYKLYKKEGQPDKDEAIDAYILSCEGGDEPGGDDYSTAEAKTVAEFIQLGDKNTYYKLTGSVSGFNPTYCSFDLTDATGSIYVYSVLDAFKTDEWKNKIKNGGTITIAGKYDYYASKNQHEVVSAAFLAYEEGETPGGSDEQKGSGTLADPYNAAKANAVASALESGAKSDDVYVKGKISSIKYTFSAQYGTATFNISDDGSTTGSQFTCYSVYYLGNRPWADGDMQVAAGDEVIIHGKLVNYNGNTPETSSKEAYVYSLNGQTEIAPSDSFGVTATEISVGASETVATIGITGNVKWTASSADATLDVTSGEGAKEIKASFAANTDTENAKVYTVKVSTTADVPTMEYIVTITQGKASSGNAVTVSVDFTPVIDALPQGSGNGVKDGTYTLGGYSFTMHANDKFYQAKTGDLYYLLIGKKDSYIELPTVDGKALVSVKFLTGSAASENVIIDIAKADGTLLGINTEKNKKGTEYTYTVNGEVNAVYRIAVTNAYNAQFQNLVLTYE